MPETAEYGFWQSPISSDLIAAASVRRNEPKFDGDSLYWLESRASEGGRTVPVRRDPQSALHDLLPVPWNVRSGVHEYGGGAYAVSDDTLYFSERQDARIYRAESGGTPVPLTPPSQRRYADLEVDGARQRLVAVCEDHGEAGPEPRQSICGIDLQTGGALPQTLVSGSDFYSNPRMSPDGERMSWLEWRHPNMPWDGTELWVAEVSPSGRFDTPRRVAGGSDESIFQPQWSPDGTLHFVSDRTGFWNLYRWSGDRVVCLHECEAEFGLPQWVFGMSTYGFADGGRICCAYCQRGQWNLALIGPDGSFESLDTPHTQIDSVTVRGQLAVFRGASPKESPDLIRLDLDSGRWESLTQPSRASDRAREYVSAARAISFPNKDGQTVHGFYYAPHNPVFEAPADEKPPTIIRLHGGPVGAVGNGFSLSTQFWTTRGFAILDLNYGGSTGYGRAYRERLNGQWGVVDVQDALDAARFLAGEGLADPERLIVKGASAGGFTALCSLAFGDVFAAGVSYYGIGDLDAIIQQSHKFESRNHEILIGPWPERRSLYLDRSPLGAVDRITAPTIFFQGSVDPIVPLTQTETMVAALRQRKVPVAYYLFEGESHGFREGANIRYALDAELAFYGTMLLRKGLRF